MKEKQLTGTLSEEERNLFEQADCTTCYQAIKKEERFASLIQKNINREKLTDEEWEYILFRLYLICCKATMEEESVTFTDHILSFLSKIGMKISRKDKPLYNECIKMVKFVRSFKREKEMNIDAFNSFYITMESKEATDLDLLLDQLEEAKIFRTNRGAFMEAYKDGAYGVITANERMYMRASERAYERAKELSKKRNNCTHS